MYRHDRAKEYERLRHLDALAEKVCLDLIRNEDLWRECRRPILHHHFCSFVFRPVCIIRVLTALMQRLSVVGKSPKGV